jgi:Flp pilus assembly protein TadD
MRRAAVRVEITSLLGLTFGLADLRILGDPSDCDRPWRPEPRPVVAGIPPSTSRLVDLVDEYPRGARLAGSLSRRRHDQGANDDATTLLRRALRAGATQAVPWIEYGLLLDEAGRNAEARAAYARGRDADSNSAWAYGCLGWADLRAGRPLRALWYSWQAYALDRRYADALTVRGLALERLGFAGWSAVALDRAIALAPRQSWATLERARQLTAAGARDDARALLAHYQASVPDDVAIADALRALSSTDSESGD